MVDVKRRYDSAARRERAAANRARVIESAGALFTSQGYSATSIREIAEHARTSPETIYNSFGSKADLLARWVDHQVVGDDEPVPLLDRGWVRDLASTDDLDERVVLVAEHGSAITRRVAPALGVIRAAAHGDATIRALLDESAHRRRSDLSSLLPLVAGDIIDRLDDETRTERLDWFASVSGDELYTELTERLGWDHDRYVRWISAAIRLALTGP
jgi:AcrR family transcriptional regulator